MFNLLQNGRAAKRAQRCRRPRRSIRKPDSVMLRGFETTSRWSSAETGSYAHLVDCHLPSSGERSTTALRRQQLVEGIDFGIKYNEISFAGGASCRGLPKRHRLIERDGIGAASHLLVRFLGRTAAQR